MYPRRTTPANCSARRASHRDDLGRSMQLFDVLEGRLLFALAPVGTELQLSLPDGLTKYEPAIAANADGRQVAVWTVQTSDLLEVYGQLFNTAGDKVGEPFHVNTFTEHFQGQPSVAVQPDGGWVVVWTSDGQDELWVFGGYASGGVFGQGYDAAGRPAGSEFQVNTITAGAQ